MLDPHLCARTEKAGLQGLKSGAFSPAAGQDGLGADLRPADRTLPCKMMILPDGKEDALVPQRQLLHVGRGLGMDDRNADPSLPHTGEGFAVVDLEKIKVHFGMARSPSGKGRTEPWPKAGCLYGQPQFARQSQAGSCRKMPNSFDVADRPVGEAQNATPRDGRLHSSPPSLKEKDAELVLECAEVAAQGGGVDTKVSSSTGDAAESSNVDYELEVA